MDNLSNNKRIAKNSVFLAIRMVIVLGISLFTTRMVLHALGVVDYGVYNVVCGFVTMFSFLNISMSNGIQRFFNYEYGKNGEEGANKVFCTSIYIQIALAILVVVLLEPIGVWYLHNKMVIPAERMFAADWIFQFSVITFVLGIFQAPFTAAVTAHEKMDFYAIVSVLDAILKFGIAYLIMIVNADKLIVYAALMVLISLINTVLYYVYCKKNFNEICFKPAFNKQMFKSMLSFSGWNLFGSFSHVMADQGINLVLNFFFGPIVNAARGVAAQINGAVQSFVANISIPVRPQVTQSYARGEISRTLSLTYSVSKMTCGIVLILAIPASIEIHYLLHLWLGNEVPEHTATFSIIILFASLIANLNAATSGVVHATGNMRQYQVWGSIIKLCAVPIAFVILRIYKTPELALLAVLICSFIAHTVGLFIVRSLVGMSIKDYIQKVIIPILTIMLISCTLLYGIHCLMPEGLVRLIVVSFMSLIVVGSLFYWLGFNKSEKELIRKIVFGAIDKLKMNKKKSTV